VLPAYLLLKIRSNSHPYSKVKTNSLKRSSSNPLTTNPFVQRKNHETKTKTWSFVVYKLLIWLVSCFVLAYVLCFYGCCSYDLHIYFLFSLCFLLGGNVLERWYYEQFKLVMVFVMQWKSVRFSIFFKKKKNRDRDNSDEKLTPLLLCCWLSCVIGTLLTSIAPKLWPIFFFKSRFLIGKVIGSVSHWNLEANSFVRG
jgi:hypothetical protein